MWEIKPKVSIGPIRIGMTKNEFTSILGDNYDVFKRFEDDDDDVFAYDAKYVHLKIDSDNKIKQISVFRPKEVFWEGIQVLGRDIKIVSNELQSKGASIKLVDAGIWNEENAILLIEVEGIVDGIEMGE